MSSRSRAKRQARRRRERLLKTASSRFYGEEVRFSRSDDCSSSGSFGHQKTVQSAGAEASTKISGERRLFRQHGRLIRYGKRILWCLAGLLAAWMLLVFSFPHTILRSLLEEQMSDALNAPVTLDQVYINPFTLQISVSGIRVSSFRELSAGESYKETSLKGEVSQPSQPVPNPSENALLSIDKLIIHPRVGSFLHPFPILASVEASRPRLDISYLGGGRFSFSDLLPSQNEDDGGVAATLFTVHNLKVSDGTVVLRDEPLNLVHFIHDIELSVPLAPSSEYEGATTPSLSAEINGTRVSLEGVRQDHSGGVQFAIRTTSLRMESFRRYLDAFTPLRLNSGEIRLDLLLGITQPRPGSVEFSLSGKIHADNIEINSPSGELVGRLKRGEAELERFTLSERLIRLSRMELDGLYLKLCRDKTGRTDWEYWMASALGAQPVTEDNAGSEGNSSNRATQSITRDPGSVEKSQTGSDTPFVIEGADLILRNSDFRWQDESFAGSQRIEITGVDGRIAEYSTRQGARTAMRLSFGIDSKGVLALEGEGTITPPSLNAELMIQDLPLLVARPALARVALSDISGFLNLKGSFRLDAAGNSGDSMLFVMDSSETEIRDLAFTGEKNSGIDGVSVSRFNCSGIHLDTGSRVLSLSNLVISGPRIRIAEETEKSSVPGNAFSRKMSGQNATIREALPEGLVRDLLPDPIASVLASWKLDMGVLSLSEGRIELRRPGGKVETLFSGLSLKAEKLTQHLDRPFSFQLRSDSAGSVIIQGSLQPVPLKGTMQLSSSDFELTALDPFLSQLTDIRLQGRAETNVNLDLAEHNKNVGLTVAGDLTLRDTVLRNAQTGKLFGGIRRITASSFRWQSETRSFSAGSILLDKARLGVSLSEKGRLDLLAAFTRSSDEHEKVSDVQKNLSQSALDGISLAIEKIRIQDGTLVFRDRRRKPELRLFLRNADATVLGMNRQKSGNGKPASVQLSGQLDGAPLSLVGQADLLSREPSASLSLSLKNANLATYSSYFTEFLGYPVEQGILDLESRLELAESAFTIKNTIKVKKLVLGPKDTRPDAPDYPVSLGLALLEDLQGNFSLELPISGRLDDPSLQVDGLVGRALGGLFTKVVTSPFALVGSFFSLFMPDDPSIRLIVFRPGQAQLSREARLRLDEVAHLLAERPKLKLEVTGWYEPHGDGDGLRRERLLYQLKELPPVVRTSEVRFSPAEYEHRLRILYSRFFAASGLEEADYMEQRLLAREHVGEAELRNLAHRRAEAVQKYIISRNQTLASRITLGSEGSTGSGSTHVELSLR